MTKKVGTTNFMITNIPVGRYTIGAKLADGRPLRLRTIGRYATAYPHWGLNLPKQ